MKKAKMSNIRFLIAVLSIFALSTLTLTVSLISVGVFTKKEIEYHQHDTSIIQGSLQSIEVMRTKFDAYNHESTSGRDLTLFSEAQLKEISTQKQHSELERLSYDEIMFLINDSVSLYYRYDTITLTYDKKRVIKCDHRQISNLEKEQATQLYKNITSDIYDIILYRISTLDAGLSETTILTTSLSDMQGYSTKLFFSDEAISINSYSTLSGIYAMSIKGDITNYKEYTQDLKRSLYTWLDTATEKNGNSLYGNMYSQNNTSPSTEHPILIMNGTSILIYQDGGVSICFPTQKLTEQKPNTDIVLYSKTPDFVKKRYLETSKISVRLKNTSNLQKNIQLFYIKDSEIINTLTSMIDLSIFEFNTDETTTLTGNFDYYEINLNGRSLCVPCDEIYKDVVFANSNINYTCDTMGEFARTIRELGENARAYSQGELKFSQLPIPTPDKDGLTRISEFNSLYNIYRDSTDYYNLIQQITEYTIQQKDTLLSSIDEDSYKKYKELSKYVNNNPDVERHLVNILMCHNPYCSYNSLLFSILIQSNEKISTYCKENDIKDKAELLILLYERYEDFLL